MGNLDATLKRYYRSIRKELPCSFKIKKQIMQQIRDNIDVFMAQNPDADFNAIQVHFGTAQEIATSYIDNQDAPELLQKIHITKKILSIVAAVLTVALLFWSTVVIWTALDAKNTYDGHIVVDIEED